MNFINIEPSLYEGFLNIFDKVDENGDLYFHVEQEKKSKSVTLKDVCDMYETSGWGLFSFAHAMPKLQERINFEVIEEEGQIFTVMRLAPFLGLPGSKDFKTELNDLKEFLAWVKEKSFETPTNDLKIILSAVDKEANLSLSGKNKELTAQLEKEMFEKINNSPNLTKWLENQKEGIINAKGKLFDLTARFHSTELMNLAERTEFYKLRDPEKKENPQDIFRSNLRKNKLGKKHSFW